MRSFLRAKAAWVATAVVALLVAATPPLHAQATGSIRGKITDQATSRPLAGAQVFIPGSSRGTMTNAAGDYLLLNVPVGTATVRVEMLGYAAGEQTITVAAGDPVRADFVLAQSAIALDELVVTGTPGATQKRAIGNAVATIQAAQVTEVAPINTVTQLLQARTPGLTIMQPSGVAGTASSIRIRGTSSYQASSEPVFYIDGVRVQGGSQGGFGVGGQSTSALDALNPDDIESIEVIKGPAAATLYGAEAAAGVIQIITKRGKPGQQELQWNAKVEMGRTDWAAEMPTNYWRCTQANKDATTGTGASQRKLYPGCQDVDAGTIISGQPLKDALRNGDNRSYTLSARGGGERFSFYAAGDREEENGVFTNNVFERTTGRANFVVTPNDKLDLAVNTSYTRSDTRLPNNDNSSWGWLRNAYRGRPGYLASNGFQEGWLGLGPEQINQYSNTTRAERFILGATVNYNPTSWLRNRLTAGLDAGTRRHTLFFPIDRTGRQPYGADQAKGYIDQYSPATRNWTLDYAGTISHKLPRDLSSDLSFGMQFNAYQFESLQARGIGLISDSVRLVSTAAQTFAFESFSEKRSLGFFVQEQVGWQNRLFVTGAVRMDNSSVFGSEIKRLFYPKVSASYVVSEEPFFNVPGVDQLRLRAAWGRAGSAPDPFAADRTYEASTLAVDATAVASVLRAGAYGNPNLKPETGSEVELGFETSLFENRAGVDVTYYNKTTSDALIPVPAAPSSGFTGNVLRNVGEINNKGLEVSVFGTPVLGRSFAWETRVGVSTNSNKFVTFGGLRDEPILQGYGGGSQRIAEGYPMGGYWAQEIRRDADGNPVLNAQGRPVLEDSARYVGPSVPTREASWTNTFTLFGNLRLYTFMDYKGGHYLFNMTEQTRDADGNSWAAVHMDPAEFNLRRHGGNLPYMEQADFVKLREISLSYDLPSSLAGKVGLRGASISLAGRNLATWTKYSGADPEVNIEGNATFTRGDYMSVPSLRRLVTTVNVRF